MACEHSRSDIRLQVSNDAVSMSENKQHQTSWFWRAPFVVMGVFAFVSMSTGAGLINVDEALLGWVTIWEAITRPIWWGPERLLELFFSTSIPDRLKDYLTTGLVTCGMFVRASLASGVLRDSPWTEWIKIPLVCIPLWPITWVVELRDYLTGADTYYRAHRGQDSNPIYELGSVDIRTEAKIFFETFVWFILVIGLNYALLFKDGEARFLFF